MVGSILNLSQKGGFASVFGLRLVFIVRDAEVLEDFLWKGGILAIGC